MTGATGSRLVSCLRVPAVRRTLTAAPLLVAAYFAFALTSSSELGTDAVTTLAELGVVVGVAAGVARFRPAVQLPWLLLILGHAAIVVSGVAYYAGRLGHLAAGPAGALGAGGSVIHLLCLDAAIAIWLYRSGIRRSLAIGIDAGIVVVVSVLLSWVYVVSPVLYRSDVLTSAKVVFVVFPLLNLVAIALAVRLWFGLPEPTPALALFAAYLMCWAVGDGLLLVTLMRTGGDLGIVDEPVRICAFVALAAAAQHPSMVAPGAADEKGVVRASGRRLLVLGLVTVVPPIVLVSQYLQGAPAPVVSIAAASVVLSVLAATRMNLLVREQHTLAITDALTGLRSRRFFDEALASGMDAYGRESQDTGLLLVDVDHFKKVNDVHGHAVGDLVLREVSERLLAAVRAGDVVARYGGEEFAILLPRANPDAVLMIAERMRQAIAAAPFELGDGDHLTVTVSIGAVSMSEGATSADHLTKAADERLYAAKAGGRNRVTTSV